MKQIVLHIVFGWICIFPAFSQYTISGVISTGERLPEKATVVLDQSSHFIYANLKGEFSIEKVQAGDHVLTFFLTGFETQTIPISLSSDLIVNVTMKPLETKLGEVVIESTKDNNFGITRLKSIDGTGIYEAKKTEVILLKDMTINKASNNARQIFAKIPGANIWESDCAGLQIGVATRGLSPNRNANFNTRQNGFDISADALGYPESYYTPPIQAVEKVELVRGAASLQYGTQFGGLVNFVIKKPPIKQGLELSTAQTINSLGFYNSYVDMSLRAGKLSYFFFNRYVTGDCWRCNTDFTSNTSYLDIHYQFSEAFKAGVEYTRMSYLAKQPGGLTDSQFYEDAKQSLRERNWFRVNWNLITLHLDYVFNPNMRLNSRTFSLLGSKDALGNLGRIDRPDSELQERDLLADKFRNWGNETRLIYNYQLGSQQSAFLIGTRYYRGFTHRQQGLGPAGDNHQFRFNNPHILEGSDFDLPGTNVSFFIENIFNLSAKLSVTPGLRYEYIRTETDGYYRNTIRDLADNIIFDSVIFESDTRSRQFVFGGLGISYKLSPHAELYTNASQNYRAINFNDIRVNNPSLIVDENIKDEFGGNVDLGARGNLSGLLNYDVSLFWLSYRDRIGTVLVSEPDPNFNGLITRTYRYRTNVANAYTYGLESFIEINLFRLFEKFKDRTDNLSVFINLGLIGSKYDHSAENGVAGNKVELVPSYNLKSGLNYKGKKLSGSLLVTSIGKQYSDATNAEGPVPGAVEGLIPAYTILDISLGYHIGKRFKAESGINNLLDVHYFTRRAAGYPGPGILPSDGRSFYFTLGFDLVND